MLFDIYKLLTIYTRGSFWWCFLSNIDVPKCAYLIYNAFMMHVGMLMLLLLKDGFVALVYAAVFICRVN